MITKCGIKSLIGLIILAIVTSAAIAAFATMTVHRNTIDNILAGAAKGIEEYNVHIVSKSAVLDPENIINLEN